LGQVGAQPDDLARHIRAFALPAGKELYCSEPQPAFVFWSASEEPGLSLNSVLLARSRVLTRLRQELAGLIE
jgi:hypothetical protein